MTPKKMRQQTTRATQASIAWPEQKIALFSTYGSTANKIFANNLQLSGFIGTLCLGESDFDDTVLSYP